MDGRPDDRSQPLLRVPRDKTPAELTLDDGERGFVLLYIAPGDRIDRIFDDTSPFVPVSNAVGTRFIARTAIACVSIHTVRAGLDDDVPQERQVVTVRLRGGAVVRGELRWTGSIERRRTLDHLNDNSSYLLVFDGDYVHFVAKAAVLSLEEAASC